MNLFNKLAHRIKFLTVISIIVLTIISCSLISNSVLDEKTSSDQQINTSVPTNTSSMSTQKIDEYAFGKAGERTEMSGIAITVTGIQKLDSLDGYIEADQTIVDTEVLIENIRVNKSVMYAPIYFILKDSEGNIYPCVPIPSFGPILLSGSLSKGEEIRGHISFVIPDTATGLTLAYEPPYLSSEGRSILINLEQIADTNLDYKATTMGPVGKIGETVESAGISLVVLDVHPKAIIPSTTPEPGKRFVDVEVVIQNVNRDEDVPYSPSHFRVKDVNGYEYSIGYSMEPSLKEGSLARGMSIRGHVGFSVPESSTGLIVIFDPREKFGDPDEVLFEDYDPIHIKLDERSIATGDIQVTRVYGNVDKIGNSVESGGIKLTVNSAERVTNDIDVLSRDGYVKIEVEIEIQNISSDVELPITHSDFRLTDAQGFEYQYSGGAAYRPYIYGKNLKKGESLRGIVPFLVPAGARDFVFSFQPINKDLFPGYEIIHIALGI